MAVVVVVVCVCVCVWCNNTLQCRCLAPKPAVASARTSGLALYSGLSGTTRHSIPQSRSAATNSFAPLLQNQQRVVCVSVYECVIVCVCVCVFSLSLSPPPLPMVPPPLRFLSCLLPVPHRLPPTMCKKMPSCATVRVTADVSGSTSDESYTRSHPITTSNAATFPFACGRDNGGGGGDNVGGSGGGGS